MPYTVLSCCHKPGILIYPLVASFTKIIQCVLSFLPVRWLMIGFASVSANIWRTGICVSFHLKIRTPCGHNTRKASLNPCRKSSRQVSLFSRPYFFPIQALSPTRSRCGGSNTTTGNDASANGNARKSAIRSGLIIRRRPSHNVCSSFLISLNIARSSFLSNQIHTTHRTYQEWLPIRSLFTSCNATRYAFFIHAVLPYNFVFIKNTPARLADIPGQANSTASTHGYASGTPLQYC